MRPHQRILIVEDEEVLAENLKTFLGRNASDVRLALDAEAALRLLDSFTPDVVVMDLILPGVDGFAAYAKILHRCRRKIGCVMITGHPTDTLADYAATRGIRHVLCKPFPLAALQRLVEESADEHFDGPVLPLDGCPVTHSLRGYLLRKPLLRSLLEAMFVFVAVPIV